MANWRRGTGLTIAWLRKHVTYDGARCLRWPFSFDRNGYGTLGYLGKTHKAHRLMCELAHGPAPTDEHQAAHSCGNGHMGCVHPLHLSWKTPAENMADSVAHGTARLDAGRRRVLLTAEQVVQIRALKGQKTQVELAEMFGVTWRQIGKILRGASWRDGKTIEVLTDEQVRHIRAMRGRVTARAMAEQMGVHRDVVGRVMRGKTYRHVA